MLALAWALLIFAAIRPPDASPEDYVFTFNGEPLDDRDVLRSYIRPAAEQLGLYTLGFGWRSLRRQALTEFQQGSNALNVFETMHQAGHTKPETTMKYTLLTSERAEKAIIGLQQRWMPANLRELCGNAGTPE